ncbi:prolipoprotein diacylglyceryl transferase [Desulfosarcina sp.]|uniref:prolipoprotein diacylglyceryl transferase n=1 Tax=Desulfosarcina sp. TaxID=2027861 RepID=UPI0029A7C3F1|nr:prolipoprotein diacylglyceryl transferase [Desulfosarcina sp.]MDX2452954.1 prolipoprotein diacylglyceryl transferase [Desulfosarcina sp.]MDX2490689.1 prolipoprotein diacylglyceryl transferase [Desulfosarcina sp.]
MRDFLFWWQHLPEHMDPVILEIGSFKLQYYGLMYIVAFAITYILASHRLRREDRFRIDADQLQGLMTAMILGLIVGARLGYVLFYNFSYYLHHPLEVILPFEFSGGIRFTGITGMSYHGGLIGVVVATVIFVRKNRLDFFNMADLIVPCIPLGYTFGRLGNFINGELFGRVTTHPIGMFFPFAPGPGRRHPSQLYEAFFEGIVLFIVLWAVKNRFTTRGAMLALYLMGYGLVRFFIEYARQPDAHLGFIFFSLSMGQLLCMAMILTGGVLLLYLKKQSRIQP